jgi:hypothetical protein
MNKVAVGWKYSVYMEWIYRELKLTEAFRDLNSKSISNHLQI